MHATLQWGIWVLSKQTLLSALPPPEEGKFVVKEAESEKDSSNPDT